jgi:hypothetical protein
MNRQLEEAISNQSELGACSSVTLAGALVLPFGSSSLFMTEPPIQPKYRKDVRTE